MGEPTTNDMIENLLAMEEVEPEHKVFMFVQLCNEEMLMNQFKKQALMLKMGMATEDPIYNFAYGVLRLVKPHLFEEQDSG